MECLLNYIGLKQCSFIPSDSGMYINSLPGIEFAEFDKIANADQVSWVGVWNDIQERAIERFRLDVIGTYSGFDKRYRLRQVTQTVDLESDTGATIAPSANQSGLVIELMRENDQFVCSNMQSLYVQSVKFYCIANGNFTITLRDADSGTVLDTFTVAGVIGWNVIKTDTQYDDVMRLSITVDNTLLSTATLDISQFNLQGFANHGWGGLWAWNNYALWFNYGCSGAAQVRGYQTDINYNSPVYGTNTFGVSCIFSVRCTYNNIVCKNKKYFATAFRLCLGIELMTQRIYSSRLNNWTTIDKKQAIELRKEYEVQYRGGQLEEGIMYEGELLKACSSIDLDLSDCCLECDQLIQWKETQM